MKIIRIWWREDGDAPCVLQGGKDAPGPGAVYDVEGVRTRAEAVARVQAYRLGQPDRRVDPGGWLRWAEASDTVTRIEE